jgi:hypothetical protein
MVYPLLNPSRLWQTVVSGSGRLTHDTIFMIGNKMKQVSSVLNNMAQDLTGSGNFKPVTVLSASTFEIIAKTVRGDYHQEGKWKLMADSCTADGITAEMLVLPKKGEPNPFEKLHIQVKDAIKSGFSKEMQALLSKETKNLDEIQQGVKNYWVRQIASKFSKVQDHILASDLKNDVITMDKALALYPEKAKKYQDNQDKKKGANKVGVAPKDPKAKVAYYLDLAIRTMQSLEKTDTNITQDIKTIRLVESKYK